MARTCARDPGGRDARRMRRGHRSDLVDANRTTPLLARIVMAGEGRLGTSVLHAMGENGTHFGLPTYGNHTGEKHTGPLPGLA